MRAAILIFLAAGNLLGLARGAAVQEVIVTNHFRVPAGTNQLRLVVKASHVVIDGGGATLQGTGRTNDLQSLENAGVGVLLEAVTDVTLKDLRVRGFANGLVIRDASAVSVTGCDLSDNYHNPAHGWGELPPRGGIVCERVRLSVIEKNRANRNWDALRLIDSDENLIEENDFSHCSNTAISLWHSSRNHFLRNNLSYGLRIDRAAGEVHARDSTGVLIETGSNDNYWFRNDVTHGGDGIFIRPLNRWVSTGNLFIENDTSYAHNNCVESWSPGNTFIRNKANHGSYGFWLGGSDHTLLIGNEAAYNGLTNGHHNAPEPGFHHGGIVLVSGPSSHTLIDGNHCYLNNGAGIAFRGDAPSQGQRWQTEHCILQRNLLESNLFGIWGRWGDAITLAANTLRDNAQPNYLTNLTHLLELSGTTHTVPLAEIRGPQIALVGQTVRFTAANTADPNNLHWHLHPHSSTGPLLEKTFPNPGFYRLGLTVENGSLASLAWQDILVLPHLQHEIGTEGNAAQWGFELENNPDHHARILFHDDPDALLGTRSLRFSPQPYPGAYATAIYPAARNATWDFTHATHIQFWIKAQNPNNPGFQNPGPLLRLHTLKGHIQFTPVNPPNLLNDPPFNEARSLWMPVRIPLTGDHQWQRTTHGQPDLQTINAISLSLDSWGSQPFNIWLDGFTVQ